MFLRLKCLSYFLPLSTFYTLNFVFERDFDPDLLLFSIILSSFNYESFDNFFMLATFWSVILFRYLYDFDDFSKLKLAGSEVFYYNFDTNSGVMLLNPSLFYSLFFNSEFKFKLLFWYFIVVRLPILDALLHLSSYFVKI